MGQITAQGREKLPFGSWGPIEETSSYIIKVRELFGSLVDQLEGANAIGLTSHSKPEAEETPVKGKETAATTRKALNEHIKAVPLKIKTYHCDHCNYALLSIRIGRC